MDTLIFMRFSLTTPSWYRYVYFDGSKTYVMPNDQKTSSACKLLKGCLTVLEKRTTQREGWLLRRGRGYYWNEGGAIIEMRERLKVEDGVMLYLVSIVYILYFDLLSSRVLCFVCWVSAGVLLSLFSSIFWLVLAIFILNTSLPFNFNE